MEIKELRYFANVCRAKSFSQGAKLSHVSPPAISKAIKKLEEELNVALFTRTTRSVSLTDAGEVLLQHCEVLFRQMETLQRDLEESKSAIRGNVRIAASEVFATFLLPTALAKVTQDHPLLVPRCFQLVPDEIVHGLVTGELDVGFAVSSGPHEGVNSHLIAESKGVLVCGRNHPLFESGQLKEGDLEKYPFVVPRHWQREYLTALDQYPEGLSARRIGATTDRMSLAISLVVEGAFLAYFPQVTIGCQLRHDELKVLEGSPAGIPFRLEALTRKGTAPRASALEIIEEVRNKVLETGGDPCGWTPPGDLAETLATNES